MNITLRKVVIVIALMILAHFGVARALAN